MKKKITFFSFCLLLACLVLLPTESALAHSKQSSHGEMCTDVHRDLGITVPLIRGEDVLELQQMLILVGLDPGPADGIYGELTSAAVGQLQEKNNIPVNGVATLAVWDKLAELIPAESVSSEEIPEPRGTVSIVIHTDKKILTVYDDDTELVSFPVAVGKYKTPTPDVVEMQKQLRAIGIYWGRADSHFGEATELFVKRYQFWTGQEITGGFSKEDYQQVEQIIDMLNTGH
ncbi:peptidoglycan hydrolase-like protein with peptidoglycan-binding domain [Desulfitispora alkaliphila]|uniref:peptidoglycan-binding protein n=1 Tax=Desulfitispora alkaliphila TaxID=622674 RepID=UPI003D1A2437